MSAQVQNRSTSKGRRMRRLPQGRAVAGSVVDLFCGVGGLSHGFVEEGFSVECGFDTDEACRYAFETNNDAPFVRKDVTELTGEEIDAEFSWGLPKVLVGCAPCQPFSTYTQAIDDPKWHLLGQFARLIKEIKPDVVSMENVSRLVRFMDGRVFDSFVRRLRRNGYRAVWDVLFCPEYGVPQSRSRLVLIASRHGVPSLPEPTHEPESYRTARDAIGDMPALEAGAIDPADSLHRASELSERNLQRIRASSPGGTWRDWSDDLVTDCHKRRSGKGYSSVYGRMIWDEPAPTMTTQFYGFGNGRFGHPEQDRGLSLREGALIQTFPRWYAFVPPGEDVEFTTIGRMVGNAVPVELGRAVARAIKSHLKEVGL